MSKAVAAGYLEPYDSWAHRIAVHRFVQDIPLKKSDRAYPMMKETADALVHLVDKPMLICWGLKDFVFGHPFLDEWIRRFPRAEVHRFEDCGHYILEDAGADILPLVEARDRSGDPNLHMIAGVRRRRRDSPLRRLSSRIANAVRRRVLRDATTDTGCGLKLFRRQAYLALPAFDHMHRFLPALIKRGGGAVLEVPVGHRPRRAGTSHYGMLNRTWIGLVDMLGVAWLQRRVKNPVVEEPGLEEMDES